VFLGQALLNIQVEMAPLDFTVDPVVVVLGHMVTGIMAGTRLVSLLEVSVAAGTLDRAALEVRQEQRRWLAGPEVLLQNGQPQRVEMLALAGAGAEAHLHRRLAALEGSMVGVAAVAEQPKLLDLASRASSLRAILRPLSTRRR
jgi:hypothetical protein